MYGLALRITNDPMLAQDVVQEPPSDPPASSEGAPAPSIMRPDRGHPVATAERWIRAYARIIRACPAGAQRACTLDRCLPDPVARPADSRSACTICPVMEPSDVRAVEPHTSCAVPPDQTQSLAPTGRECTHAVKR